MVNSQNGWRAYANTNTFTRFNAGGRGWWAANADVAVIFADLIEWFDRNVEPVIRKGEEFDDWSWANRLVRDSTTVVSNHGSATAIDINATKHPRGVHDTFSPSVQKVIRDKIKTYNGVIRWGGDYTTTVDDMHFEINKNASQTKIVANAIRERDLFTKEDKTAIADIVKAALIDVLTKELLVANKPLNEGDPQGANWTVSGVLAAGDLKSDRANADLKKLLART